MWAPNLNLEKTNYWSLQAIQVGSNVILEKIIDCLGNSCGFECNSWENYQWLWKIQVGSNSILEIIIDYFGQSKAQIVILEEIMDCFGKSKWVQMEFLRKLIIDCYGKSNWAQNVPYLVNSSRSTRNEALSESHEVLRHGCSGAMVHSTTLCKNQYILDGFQDAETGLVDREYHCASTILCHLQQHLHQLQSYCTIQSWSRLVQKQHCRVVDQIHTNWYSSSLPTRNSRNLQNNTKKQTSKWLVTWWLCPLNDDIHKGDRHSWVMPSGKVSRVDSTQP